MVSVLYFVILIFRDLMSITIRPINTLPEYHAVEDLQREIWGAADVEIMPYDLMLTAHKNGGVVLGAFSDEKGSERLVGFVFGFVGLQPDGSVKHCSHVAGVAAGYRDRNVGYRLKAAQREYVLAQGINLITWTFDPLESRNARFNFHKLGVTCRTFYPNLYGEMRDALNAGLPSDRFQVDWRIASDRVERHLRGEAPDPRPAELLSAGVPVIDPSRMDDASQVPESERMLVEIPANFQRVKAEDRELALRWRMGVRTCFETVFARGLTATDLLVEHGRSFYMVEQYAEGE